MSKCLHKTDLSPARRQLLHLLQRINFGRIEALVVHNGQPVFDPEPEVIQTLKFPGDNTRRAEANAEDFALKAEVVALFAALDRLGSGQVERIEVRHGLPITAEVRGQPD
jgi:hypothetical protein